VAVPWVAWEALDRRYQAIHHRLHRQTQIKPAVSLAPSQGRL